MPAYAADVFKGTLALARSALRICNAILCENIFVKEGVSELIIYVSVEEFIKFLKAHSVDNYFNDNKKVIVGKIHSLDKIFLKLPKEIQKEIYDIWRGKIGQKLPEHPYVSKMFSDNLEANAKVFTRFRYANEWAGAVVSLHHSFTPEQFEKFSPVSLKRPFGSPEIYDGFLEQFALSLKTYAENLIGKTYNS